MVQEENDREHREISEEYRFYHAVKEGDLEFVMENCAERKFENPEGMGILSKNPLTNIKYHFCVTAALLARHCAEGGMEMEKAYSLSDYYIGKLDYSNDIQTVVKWHDEMVIDFTRKMQQQKLHNLHSDSIQQVLDYIYKNIKRNITLNEVADAVALSPAYLSRLFMKEMGMSLKDYILEKKIERAQNLLKYSDISSTEIAQFLAFSSQSHFIATFKKIVGMTPKKYKDQYARNVW